MANAQFNKVAFLEGLHLKQTVREIAEVVIQTESDANRFNELVGFYISKGRHGKATARAFATTHLRNEKIELNAMDKQEFLDMYEQDQVGALEYLFQEKVRKEDVERFLGRWINEGKTIGDLFDKHVKSPYDRFLSFVL